MSTDKPIGDIVDSLGVATTIDDTDLIGGAIVILKVIDEDGDVRLNTCWSDGMTWFERVGMLRIAEQMDHPTDDSRKGEAE